MANEDETVQDASKTQRREPTSASQWRSRRAGDLLLPSGNVALVRNPGIQHFIKTGIIPNQLKGLILQVINDQKKDLKAEEILRNEDDIDMVFDLFDAVLLEVVVEPKVKAIPMQVVENEDGEKFKEPVPIDQRDPEFIYPDEVDFDDKQFIFQFAVGGTRDLESFREQQSKMLDAVSSGKPMEMSSE